MSKKTDPVERGAGTGTPRLPGLPAPGDRPRPYQEDKLFRAILEVEREQRSLAGLPPDDEECERIARREVKRRKSWTREPCGQEVGHRSGESQLSKYPESVKLKALRESWVGQALREQFEPSGIGRPSNHAHAIAVLETLLWSDEHPELKRCHQKSLEPNKTLDWIFGLARSDLRGYNAVCDAIGGAERRETGAGRRPGLCDQISRDFADRYLAEAAQALGEYIGEGFDRHAAIDGTMVRIAAQQRQSFSAEDEAAIDRGRGTGYGTHGGEYLRGYNVLAVTLTSATIPIAAQVLPANISESTKALGLIEQLYKHWPDINLEYLVGDSAFDKRWQLYRDLEMCFGVHLVAQRNDEKKIPRHLRDSHVEGIPACACSGTLTMMNVLSSDDFWGPKKRRQMGLAPGEDATAKQRERGAKQRVRYRCEHCKRRTSVWPGTVINGGEPNRRWAPAVTHHPNHKKQYALRQELMRYRNSVESAWAVGKKSGIDLSGAKATRWTNTQHQNELFIKFKLVRHSLLQVLQRDGTLDRLHAEALAAGALIQPGASDDPLDLAA